MGACHSNNGVSIDTKNLEEPTHDIETSNYMVALPKADRYAVQVPVVMALKKGPSTPSKLSLQELVDEISSRGDSHSVDVHGAVTERGSMDDISTYHHGIQCRKSTSDMSVGGTSYLSRQDHHRRSHSNSPQNNLSPSFSVEENRARLFASISTPKIDETTVEDEDGERVRGQTLVEEEEAGCCADNEVNAVNLAEEVAPSPETYVAMLETTRILRNTELAWKTRVEELKKLRMMVESSASLCDLDSMTLCIVVQLSDGRLPVQTEVHKLLCSIARLSRGKRHSAFFKRIIPKLLNTITMHSHSAEFVDRVETCLATMLSLARPLSCMGILISTTLTCKHAIVRRVCIDVIGEFITDASPCELRFIRRGKSMIENMIVTNLRHSDIGVRESIKYFFGIFKTRFPEDAAELISTRNLSRRRLGMI